MYRIFKGAIFRQYLVILTANLCVLCIGLSMGWPSSMLVKLKDGTGTGLPRPVTDEELSWIASIGILSSIPCNLMIGFVMDKIGRKSCLILGFVPRLTAYFTLLFATEIWTVLLGRAFDGLAFGLTIAVVPTYTSEIASKEIRGALGTTSQIASVTGMLIAFAVAPFLPYFEVNLMYLCIVGGVFIPIWFLPETPHYLYSKGRKEDAKGVLTYLRASDKRAQEEIEQFEIAQSQNKNDEPPNIIEIFKDRITQKTTAKALLMCILTELLGYNVVLHYMMTILQSTNTTLREEIGSILAGCIQVVACLCTIFLTDRLGRKPILIGTLGGKAVGMIGLGTFFYLQENGYEITGFLNYMPTICLMLVIFSYNAGLGSLFWMLIAELFHGPARAVGISMCTFITSSFMFLNTKFFPTIINAIGPAITYWLFSSVSIIYAGFILFCVPETKGKTFLEIQTALGRDVKSR